ncbi:MAG: hypothetical protein ACM3ML_14795 [Micromonosporaceae bacterium]
MSDNDHLQVVLQDNIFQPRVSADQRRLAVRYDALRSALGKFGRPFGRRTSLVLPPPVLHLHRDEVWEPRPGDCRSRRAWLVFAEDIKEAHSVTLWDAENRLVGATHYPFAANKLIPVEDPGAGGSVEVRNSHDVTFMVGVPVRTFDIGTGDEPREEVGIKAPEESSNKATAKAAKKAGAEAPEESSKKAGAKAAKKATARAAKKAGAEAREEAGEEAGAEAPEESGKKAGAKAGK